MSTEGNGGVPQARVSFAIADDDNANVARLNPELFSEAPTGSGTEPRDGDLDAGGNAFDPTRHTGKRNADGSWRKRKGRRSGGNNRSTGGTRSLRASVDGLTRALIVVHSSLASVTKISEIELDDEDATSLSQATVNVLEAYDVPIDPRTAAVVGLVMTAGTIYGSKIQLYRMRRKEEIAKEPNIDPASPEYGNFAAE